jgi:hypothetical protein
MWHFGIQEFGADLKNVKLPASDKMPSKKERSDNQFQGKIYLCNIF